GFPLGHHEKVDASEVKRIDPAQVRVAEKSTYDKDPKIDAGDALDPHRLEPPSAKDKLFALDSPALWAIIAIAAIGMFNLMGPKHTGLFAIIAAVGMVFITLLI